MRKKSLYKRLFIPADDSQSLKLQDGSRIGVIGAGPAGSFFSYFLLEMADRLGIKLHIDIFEQKDFFNPGPKGCNHCGGIISETLVQNLASEGINLPSEIIQRGIKSYKMHTDTGSVNIETPLNEKRIGAVHRGSGPKGATVTKWGSFDAFLLILAIEKGARLYQDKVENIIWNNSKPRIITKNGDSNKYDLVTAAVGINSTSLKMFQELDINYIPPETTKTFIQEYYFGEQKVLEYLGNSMHVFLMDIPKLEFAALIPKGDYVTLCMLGENIDTSIINSFFITPRVKNCFPPGTDLNQKACKCLPKINIKGTVRPFADRILFLGDCGMNRLYKDGIGVAFRTAKIAATTVIFEGVSVKDFEKSFLPVIRNIYIDNLIGKLVFFIIGILQKFRFARQAIVRMVQNEQKSEKKRKDMSIVLWDMFSGSSAYAEIFLRTLHPLFLIRYVYFAFISLFNTNRSDGED